jgi:tRNA A37 threonylcarbamoyladenosine synthetase subunit TsaC/SUA5/YrdC
MHEPSLVVRGDDRDAQGHLRPEHVAEIDRVLQASGFVLLPSDTAYSIAAWLRTGQIRDQINKMLHREDAPISLAFPSLAAVRTWSEPNAIADRLLQRFTPGPITVVRRATRLVPVEVAEEAWRSQNRTIGARIPNSAEERQVAGVGPDPVTTVAVRDLDSNDAVTSFAMAFRIVQDGISKIGGAPWCAIEGEIRYPDTSTVVEVLSDDASFRLVRPGAIPVADIRACIDEG